jgi:FkbM family methyltransferase
VVSRRLSCVASASQRAEEPDGRSSSVAEENVRDCRDRPLTAEQSREAEVAERGAFFTEAARHTELISVRSGGSQFLVPTWDKKVGRLLFTKGSRGEMSVLRRCARIMETYGFPGFTGRTFVDIGANIGTSSITALAEHGFAAGLACEPEPMNYRVLRANAVLNAMEDTLQALNVAVSDREGTLTMAASRASSGGHRVAREGESVRGETFSVPCVTLDGLVARGQLTLADVGLLWMDAQGHEGHVLRGASSLLAVGAPMITEYKPASLRLAGGLDAVNDAIREHFTHFLELRSVPVQDSSGGFQPASEIDRFAERFDTNFTDILVVRMADDQPRHRRARRH